MHFNSVGLKFMFCKQDLPFKERQRTWIITWKSINWYYYFIFAQFFHVNHLRICAILHEICHFLKATDKSDLNAFTFIGVLFIRRWREHDGKWRAVLKATWMQVFRCGGLTAFYVLVCCLHYTCQWSLTFFFFKALLSPADIVNSSHIYSRKSACSAH